MYVPSVVAIQCTIIYHWTCVVVGVRRYMIRKRENKSCSWTYPAKNVRHEVYMYHPHPTPKETLQSLHYLQIQSTLSLNCCAIELEWRQWLPLFSLEITIGMINLVITLIGHLLVLHYSFINNSWSCPHSTAFPSSAYYDNHMFDSMCFEKYYKYSCYYYYYSCYCYYTASSL